jgi:hypothetical protein
MRGDLLVLEALAAAVAAMFIAGVIAGLLH